MTVILNDPTQNVSTVSLGHHLVCAIWNFI